MCAYLSLRPFASRASASSVWKQHPARRWFTPDIVIINNNMTSGAPEILCEFVAARAAACRDGLVAPPQDRCILLLTANWSMNSAASSTWTRGCSVLNFHAAGAWISREHRAGLRRQGH